MGRYFKRKWLQSNISGGINLRNKLHKKEYDKTRYKENKEILVKQHNVWCKNNRGKATLYMKKWRSNNKDKLSEQNKRYRLKNSIKLHDYNRNRSKEQKLRCYNHYSNYNINCNCCGERRIEFLSIDHIYDNGKERRKIHAHGRRLYSWIIRNNFPNEFQILCMNCNFAKGHDKNHICPHLKELIVIDRVCIA